MNLTLTIFAYLLSAGIGYLSLRYFLHKEKKHYPLLLVFLAPGLGMALTAFTLFYNFLLLDRLNKIVVVAIHVLALAALGFSLFKKKIFQVKSLPSFGVADAVSVIALLIFSIPVWTYAHAYSMGGWDAWQVWNFKAKFLFLSEDQWKNMLDAKQWMSSPHYPLFLPLSIVWGWIWTNNTTYTVPLFVSVLYTFLCGGLLYSGLKTLTHSRQSILAALVLYSLPLFIEFGTSQYCDVILGYYLLASLICSLLAYRDRNHSLAFLSGTFLGALSFTKPEGTIAAGMLFLLNILFLYRKNISLAENKKTWLRFTMGTFLFSIPAILFALIYSPGNQTFINGLISSQKPSDLPRLQFTLVALGISVTGRHWVGFWIAILAGLVLGWKRSLKRDVLIVPLFLLSYLLVIIFYYWLNTYFEIFWWLKNSLNRIEFTLLPTFVLWAFCALHGTRPAKN